LLVLTIQIIQMSNIHILSLSTIIQQNFCLAFIIQINPSKSQIKKIYIFSSLDDYIQIIIYVEEDGDIMDKTV
jgi:hypothetical protein